MPYHTGITAVTWQELCPCLNSLDSTGKGWKARSVAALRPFVLTLLPFELL
jgi:hypothetical protein